MTKIENPKQFGNLDLGFVPPFGDSHKYNQIRDLSIYGIGFRYSYLEFEIKGGLSERRRSNWCWHD
jgi:hypothetical protein